MSLRSKVLITLSLVIVMYTVLNYFVQRFVIFPSFVELERNEAKKDMQRCIEALRREIYHLGILTDDWAAWNDTYKFVQDPNTDYTESNLVVETFTDNNLNLIYICNTTGQVVWGEVRDTKTGELISVKEFSTRSLLEINYLIEHKTVESSISGLLMTENGPLLIASKPIVTSDRKGPIRGTFIMGRFLTDELLEKIIQQTSVPLRIWQIPRISIPADKAKLLNQITPSAPLHISAHKKNLLEISTVFADVHGSPALLMQAAIPRNISAKGVAAIKFVLVSILTAGVIILVVLMLFLQKTFVKPISVLTKHAVAIRESNDLSIRLSFTRKDEIGELSQELDRMVGLLQTAHTDLETRIEQRTAELAEANRQLRKEISERKLTEKERQQLQAQLHRAQKMEAIGTLAGGVAHDLNNILSGLVSYPELLLMKIPQDSPLRNPILTIQKSGEKAATIVQDLLTLARRGVAVTNVLNLNQIISEYLKSREYEALKLYHPQVEVETGLKTDLLNILGSPVHLSKTIMNLVSNAAESMPDGGTIFISTENRYIDKPISGYDEVMEGDYVVLTVSDTGIGISSEDLTRIFEPFYTQKVMGRSGTGLGMSVVWGTVKDHKGYIDVRSFEGKGTAFTLYFPVSRQKITEDKSRVSMQEYMGGGESILVVDDVQEQRKIASEILSELGYLVTSVASGEEGVEHMKYHSVDLLVLDMIMDPGMDGLETYKKILDIHPGQKAIIASGFSETDRVKEAQKLGAGAYIKKPYSLEKIGLAVRNELDKHQL